MIFTEKINHQVVLRKLIEPDYDNLCAYLDNLSTESRKRFG